MNNLKAFFAENVKEEETTKVAVSNRFKDENGKIIPWEIKAVTSQRDEELREKSTKRVDVEGNPGVKVPELDVNTYIGLLISECVVFPDLHNAELQNSYKVMDASSLAKIMLKGGEYQELSKQIQKVNGFNIKFEDEVDEAKN
ncbi:MAG: phage portal protein [Anaerovoracaceae bacterium]